ncbi:hypothetical protein ACWFOB_23100, partial [Bacillus subtilis]
ADTVHSAVVWRAWEKSLRPVYAMHPALVECFRDIDSDQIPTSVLSKLDHPFPLVVFPEPLALEDGWRGLGFMLYGIADDPHHGGYRHSPIKDPHRVEIGLHFYLQAPEPPGGRDTSPGDRPATVTTMTVVIDGRPNATMHIDDGSNPHTRVRGGRTSPTSDTEVDETNRRDMHTLTRAALGSLLYLCSDEPETERGARKIRRDTTRSRGGKRPSPDRNKTAAAIDVGWRLGPTLPRVGAPRDRTRRSSDPTGTGRGGWTMPPHLRRPHLRLVPTKQGPVVRFIPMTTVNKHKIGADGAQVATVMPVRPTRTAATTVEPAAIDAIDAASAGHRSAHTPAPAPSTGAAEPSAAVADSTADTAVDLAPG